MKSEKRTIDRKKEAVKEVGSFTSSHLAFSLVNIDLEDGRKYLCFLESIDAIPEGKKLRGRENMRVSYRVFNGKAMLLGIVVPDKFAGMNLGKEIINHFVRFVEQSGLKFMGTGKINKPMIAQALVRAGFEPVSQEVLVEILPRSTSNTSRIPNIQVLANRKEAKLITASHGGDFYKVISSDEVISKYPFTTDESVVAIQTRYVRKKPSLKA
jgi:hypothetical protein